MKTFILTTILLSSSAFACEVPESQLMPTEIVKVDKARASCKAFIDLGKAEITENPMCFTTGEASLYEGIEVGLNKDGTCRFEVGQKLSGILLELDGEFFLESSLN